MIFCQINPWETHIWDRNFIKSMTFYAGGGRWKMKLDAAYFFSVNKYNWFNDFEFSIITYWTGNLFSTSNLHLLYAWFTLSIRVGNKISKVYQFQVIWKLLYIETSVQKDSYSMQRYALFANFGAKNLHPKYWFLREILLYIIISFYI